MTEPNASGRIDIIDVWKLATETRVQVAVVIAQLTNIVADVQTLDKHVERLRERRWVIQLLLVMFAVMSLTVSVLIALRG